MNSMPFSAVCRSEMKMHSASYSYIIMTPQSTIFYGVSNFYKIITFDVKVVKILLE